MFLDDLRDALGESAVILFSRKSIDRSTLGGVENTRNETAIITLIQNVKQMVNISAWALLRALLLLLSSLWLLRATGILR